jgi:hypothetical protein
MPKRIIILPKAGIHIDAYHDDNELHIFIENVGGIWTWPEHCRVKEPDKDERRKRHSLIITSPNSRMMAVLFINDPTEAELLAGVLAGLKESQ